MGVAFVSFCESFATQTFKNGLSKPFLRVFFFGLNPFLTSYTPISNTFLTLFYAFCKFFLTASNAATFSKHDHLTEIISLITFATIFFCV